MTDLEATRVNSQDALVNTLERQPYKRIFAEIEQTTISPISAYAYFRSTTAKQGLDPIFYTPMAITSGGFGRDLNLSRTEAVRKNAEYAQIVRENLVRSIPGSHAEDFLIPSELGKVKGWGQAEYLMFFMHIIAGLDIREATTVEENIGLEEIRQMPGFLDESLPPEQRWELGYKHIPERYVALTRSHQLGKGNNGADLPKNIRANILILDPQISLGANAERLFGNLLGISEYAVSIDEPTSDLVSHRRDLLALGADALTLQGRRQIAGRQNQINFWQMRSDGFRFRTSGVFTAIWDREVGR